MPDAALSLLRRAHDHHRAVRAWVFASTPAIGPDGCDPDRHLMKPMAPRRCHPAVVTDRWSCAEPRWALGQMGRTRLRMEHRWSPSRQLGHGDDAPLRRIDAATRAGLDASTRIQHPIRSAQIPIDERSMRGAQPFRGFLPWRLPDAGPSASRGVGMAGIRNPCMGRCLSSKFLHGLISLFDQAGDHLLVRCRDPFWPSLGAPAGSVGGRIVLPWAQPATSPRGARHRARRSRHDLVFG